MDAEHKILYQMRGEISSCAQKIEILLNKIQESKSDVEIDVLSEIAAGVCKQIVEKSEECGIILENMKD